MTLFRALRRRPFALLWTGQSLSRLGDFVYEIALAWWVLQKTGSAQTMSLVLIFSITPSLLFSLIGRRLVDRLSPVALTPASDAARAGPARGSCASVARSARGVCHRIGFAVVVGHDSGVEFDQCFPGRTVFNRYALPGEGLT